jgi:hypothetical protein
MLFKNLLNIYSFHWLSGLFKNINVGNYMLLLITNGFDLFFFLIINIYAISSCRVALIFFLKYTLFLTFLGFIYRLLRFLTVSQDNIWIVELNSLRPVIQLNSWVLANPKREELVRALILNVLLAAHLIQLLLIQNGRLIFFLLLNFILYDLAHALIQPFDFVNCHFNDFWILTIDCEQLHRWLGVGSVHHFSSVNVFL